MKTNPKKEAKKCDEGISSCCCHHYPACTKDCPTEGKVCEHCTPPEPQTKQAWDWKRHKKHLTELGDQFEKVGASEFCIVCGISPKKLIKAFQPLIAQARAATIEECIKIVEEEIDHEEGDDYTPSCAIFYHRPEPCNCRKKRILAELQALNPEV
jgi:hypothetical protein